MALTTRGSLLFAVRCGDEVCRHEFYDMYKQLILLRDGDLQLNQTEKEELVQMVMRSFFNSLLTFWYDKSKGIFCTDARRATYSSRGFPALSQFSICLRSS